MDKRIQVEVAREAKVMTRKEVVVKAIEGRITWVQAADIIGVSSRQMRRLKERYERYGYGGLRDYRGGRPRRKRIPVRTIRELCRLKRDLYADFSTKHFHEKATEKHGLKISYTWARLVLQAAGLAEKAPARGKYRRARERRPMTGMLLHLDGSTHEWIPGLPKRDLIIMLDDADGRALYGKFVEEEGTMSTFEALKHVLKKHGRFCELYHDRGSHFGRTSSAELGPDEEQQGQVSRALKVLGIRQIFARTPQARGRSERYFGTVQGRLPQELRAAGIRSYEQANPFLTDTFLPDLNRRFVVRPEQSETAFMKLVGMDLDLLLSVQAERTVRNDNTVSYNKTILQIPKSPHRAHYVRCQVTVHEFPDRTLAVSYQGRCLARFTRDGELLAGKKPAAGQAAA
jgi:transposase